jgi:3'(2'), 5'-bisphosphate nucleotidase
VFSDPYQQLLAPLRALCGHAAESILSNYHASNSSDHQIKSDDSPVTAADLAAHEILVQGLEDFGLPILSEESPAELMAQRRQWQRYWLVDPLDGTREFLGRTGEFTINVALVENHRAVFGMIAVPLSGEIYVGVPGQGALKSSGDSWASIRCRGLDPTQPTVVLTSRRHRGEQLDAWMAELPCPQGGIQREYIGSALKFCWLAEGRADFYPRFSPCSEWDTAAGQALLEGAGGRLSDLQGDPLRYNMKDSLLNPHFIAQAS